MRILFISNRFPGHQRRGDQLRALQHIRHLSARHQISLLSFEQIPADAPAMLQMQDCCERVIMLRRSSLNMLLRAGLALPGPLPLQVAMFRGTPSGLNLAQLLAEGRFDLAHVQLARLGPLIQQLAPLPVVLDLVDALSVNMRRRALHDRGPLRWLAALESPRLLRYERQLCEQVHIATVCSAADREAIGADLTQLRLLHNGVALEQFPLRPLTEHPPELVFVGNLGYFPNVDGVLWFAEHVLPLLLAQRADWRLRLVGVRPAAALRRLARRCMQIELVGEVEHVWPHLHRAAIAIAPLRAGSGQQLKILEAMAAGTPVVSTALSAAGLAALDGVHLHVASDAEQMARQISELYAHPEQSRQLALNAHQWVAENYSWATSAAVLDDLWHEAATSAAGVH